MTGPAAAGVRLARWPDLCAARGALIAEPVADGLVRLSERVVAPGERSFFYLLEGRDRDCLIDGGWGFCGSPAELPRDPAKPLVAVATHSHFDHIGMLHLVGERAGHAAEAAVFADPTPAATQALPYLEGRDVLAGGGVIAAQTVRQSPCPLTRLLSDGDGVDLGGRRLTVLHLPGHSPGSLAFLDEAQGLLFAADTIHDGHIYDDIPGADRAALLLSHRRLAEVDFALAFPGHGAILSRAETLERSARYRRGAGC